jgi:hypothetical protein
LNAKIGFLLTVIVTIITAVYALELGIHVTTGSGRPEYLALILIVLAMLVLGDIFFYRRLHSINSDL